MSLDVIHEQMSDVVNTKVSSIISKAELIEPSYTLSEVMNKIVNAEGFDVFCKHKNSIMTLSYLWI